MKQFRLLLTLLALFTGVGTLSAQTWTASEVGEGYALLYNVGTGQYFTRGNGYNTQASIGAEGAAMIVELKAVGEKYFIRTGVNNTAYGLEHLSGSVYTDQSRNKQSTWTFTQVATDNGPVYNIVSADNHSGGEGTYLTVQDESTIVGEGSDGTEDNAKWKVFLYTDQQDKLQTAMVSATEENPVDVTAYILDHNFAAFKDYANEFWTMQSSNYNPNGGNITNPCAESWCAAFTLSQSITVPNGYYKLRAQAALTDYSNAYDGTNYPVVYLNDATVPFNNMDVIDRGTSMTQLSNSFSNANYYTEYTDVVTVVDKSITIGVKGTRTDTWCIWDNFQLLYLGPLDLSTYETALAEAVAAAEATEGTIPAAAYNEIAAVVTANNNTYDNAEDYTAAIQAINNAVAQYASAAIVADYSHYKDVKTAVLAVAPNTVTSTADTQVEAATTAEAVDAAIATLRAALLTELPNITIAEGEYIDVTNALVDNPTVRHNTNYWTIEGTPNGGYSWGVVNYEECEFYNNNFKFYQTLTLGTGTWEFGVTGFHRAGDHSTYFYAGEDKILIPGVESSVVNTMAEAKEYFDAGNGKVALKFALDDTKTIEIGIDNQDTRTDRWTIFRDFTLKYYGTAIDLTPYKEALQEAIAAANVIAEELAGKVPNAATEHFTDVINENNKEYTSVADYQAAKAAIEAATTAIQTLQEPYNRYQIIKTAVAALDDDTSAFIEDVRIDTTEAENIAEAAVTEEGIYEAISKLKDDAVTFLRSITVKGNKKIDVTNIWAINADFEEGSMEGWWNDGSTYAGIQDNKAFDNTQGNYYAERWHAAGTIDLNQIVYGLPSGNYEISAYLYTDTPDGIFYANDTQIPFSNSQNYSITIHVDETATIKFGAKCTLTESTWICADDFKIAFVGVDHSRYNSVKEAVLSISTDINIAEAEALNAAANNTEDIENAVKALRSALINYLPTAEIPSEPGYIDLTNALIDNPTVRQNTDYWTADGTPNSGYSWGVVNYEECEFYQQNFDFYQTLTLCKGTFEFGVTGFHRAGNHNTHFYAGENKILIPGVESSVVNSMAQAQTYFDDGNGRVALKFALENESNTLKIGIVNNDTETDKWTIFRDFTLKYFGSQVDLSIYEEAWQEAVAAANAAIEANPNVIGEELAAVNTAKADTPEQTIESYQAKTNALNDATQAFIAAATAYNTFAEYKTFVNELTLPYADQTKKPTTEGIEDPTTAAEAKAKAEAILVSLRPYFESNALAEGVTGAVNMTDKIGQAYAPATAEEITAWTITDNSETYDPTIRSNEPFTQGDGTSGGPYYDGGDLWNTTYIANYKQEIELPAGKYLLTVTARASLNCKKFELYAGENTLEMTKIGATVGTGIFDRGWNDESLEFTINEAQTVEIGVNIEQDKPYNWYSFSRFRLVQLEGDAAKAGDVNGDTKVDVADITAMVNIIVAEGYEKVADLDGDNDVDAEDLKALVNLVLGKE